MREKIAVVARIGLEIGSTILQRISNREHPSMTAASKRSCGIVLNCWRNKKILNIFAIQGIMSAWYVLIHPSFVSRKYDGMRYIGWGTIIMLMNK
jgi:hypothetical protein